VIVVTGGAGMIGSRVIAALNRQGISDILVVDNLVNGKKMKNLAGLNVVDYFDRDDFLSLIDNPNFFGEVTAVLHKGACSATTEWDGQFLMKNNFEYSKRLLWWCENRKIPFIYASSASVYGNAIDNFIENFAHECPINMYAYSKWQFDQYFRRHQSKIKTRVVGLRYFNVYGPGESQKESMASTVWHFANQINASGTAKVFSGSHGYEDGDQRRDFVYVDDCAKVNLWALQECAQNGIYNVGTGSARSFNEIIHHVRAWFKKNKQVESLVEYIPMPEKLVDSYQCFTQADINSLRSAGYVDDFLGIEEGIERYLDWLDAEGRFD
jgi:ADP-L-glycero-D-manno-heptose 6-epimerase